MHLKNLEALSRGREYMLAKVANLSIIPIGTEATTVTEPPEKDAGVVNALEEFKSQFGELYPDCDLHGYLGFVVVLRYHWNWRANGNQVSRRGKISVVMDRKGRGTKLQEEFDDVSAWCTHLLNRRTYGKSAPPPAIEIDFAPGVVRIVPETLQDWLIISLLECRRNLAVCQRKTCTSPYFVKTSPRNSYCSEKCFQLERDEYKRSWEETKRGNRSIRRGVPQNRLRRIHKK